MLLGKGTVGTFAGYRDTSPLLRLLLFSVLTGGHIKHQQSGLAGVFATLFREQSD